MCRRSSLLRLVRDLLGGVLGLRSWIVGGRRRGRVLVLFREDDLGLLVVVLDRVSWLVWAFSWVEGVVLFVVIEGGEIVVLMDRRGHWCCMRREFQLSCLLVRHRRLRGRVERGDRCMVPELDFLILILALEMLLRWDGFWSEP